MAHAELHRSTYQTKIRPRFLMSTRTHQHCAAFHTAMDPDTRAEEPWMGRLVDTGFLGLYLCFSSAWRDANLVGSSGL